ncbi:MAG: reverse transcriptase domain-containing protein [Tepidiformaceae bacterium]
MGNFSEHYYRDFQIPKRRGSRTIHAPRVALKVIQRWIHDHMLAGQPLTSEVNAFAPERSIFTNAGRHLGRKNFLALDVAEFFLSIGKPLVQRVFEGIGYNPLVAHQLASLCTLGGGLPQGAPTSPMLSNLIFQSVDEQLKNFAITWNAEYSRYADDLAFTSDSHYFGPEDVAAVGAALKTIGLQLNERKTKRIGGGYRHEVAGLSTTSAGAMPARWKRRQWRATFHNAELDPGVFTERTNELLGIAGYVGQYDPQLGERYKAIVQHTLVRTHRG